MHTPLERHTGIRSKQTERGGQKQRKGKWREGRRKAWRPGRVPGQGVCHRCAPTTQGGMCWVDRNALLTHTHTYIHRLHRFSFSHRMDRTTQATTQFIETVDVNRNVKCFSGFAWLVVGRCAVFGSNLLTRDSDRTGSCGINSMEEYWGMDFSLFSELHKKLPCLPLIDWLCWHLLVVCGNQCCGFNPLYRRPPKLVYTLACQYVCLQLKCWNRCQLYMSLYQLC